VSLLIAAGALLLAGSYPPFRLPALSFVALVPAVLLLRRLERAQDARGALRCGFWYGVATQGLVLYWLVVALWHFTPFSALGYIATIAVYGLWYALLFWLVVRVRARLPAVQLWVVFPVAWTAVEWAIGHQGDIRFPWLGLGTSLADAPVLVQWADIAGARGVTLWLAWCNVAIVEALVGMGEGGRGKGWMIARRLAPVVLTIAAAWSYGAWRMRTLPLRDVGTIGLIQPNEGFREKWDPRHADSVMAKLLDMTRALERGRRLDLVAWPEAAVPNVLWWEPTWDGAISALARETRTPIVAGALHATARGVGSRNYDYYNAAYVYDSTGQWRTAPVYAKHYLVPVVERVPFVPVRLFRAIPGLGRWSGGFAPGRELPLYQAALGRFGVLICYESAFEDLARGYRREGADFLVNITNDAWYGRTAGPYQHATHLVLRAIETRAGIARAANDGISEFVDPLGRAYAATDLEREASVADRLRTSDVIPLYVRWGDWVGLLVVIATIAFAGLLALDAWRSRRPV
jgi:apolipoprotein N-acyltransferase